MLPFIYFVVYTIFLLIKTKPRPDRDGGLVEADTPKRTMKRENLLKGVKKKKERKRKKNKRRSHDNDTPISSCHVRYSTKT